MEKEPQYVLSWLSQRSSLWDQPHESILGTPVLAGPSALSFLDTHPHQVAYSNGEANGQCWGAHVAIPSVVRGCKDAGGQLEGEDDLHHKGLAWGRVVVELQTIESNNN